MREFRLATLTMVLVLTVPAFAADTPLALYESGNYEAAIAAGEAKGDGESLTVAARAALGQAKLRDSPCLECFRKAQALARRAIAADAKIPEAYVYLASAMGHESHIIGTMAARSAGLPDQSKKAIDTALSLAPNDGLALAALGGWNIEVVRLAGRMIASWMFGASFDAGKDAFRRAFAAAPDDLTLRYEYALQLVAYNAKKERSEIASALDAAMKATPRTAYERAIQARVKHMNELLAKNDFDALSAQVRRYQHYPD